MFTKSIRVKIVFTFIIIVLISIFISFGIGRFLSEKEVTPKQLFLKIAGDAATLIAITEPSQREQVMDILSDYNIFSEVVQEGDKLPFSLTDEEVALLFQYGVSEPLSLNTESGPIRFIGVPNIDDNGNAIILKIDLKPFLEIMQRTLLTGLILVLVIGSLLILLASNTVVEPVRKLTSAVKKMAKGDLSFRIQHKVKDEFGELMDSFNYMADELQKVDKMRENFVSNVSHEIQSPITSIRGFTKAIRDGVIPADQQKEYLDIIYQETIRLSKLSDYLLRLASLDSDSHPFYPVEYRLDEQLRRMILVTEPLWTEKNLTIELNLESDIIQADSDLLEQVWQNLLTNAIKYSPQNGHVEVKMEIDLQFIHVHIKDDGRGIPDEDLPYVFDRFYMVDKARSRSEGNGLGLSIVKKIIELHKYEIALKSKEGKGTCITVSIPR